jgi:hypothetical protein
MRIRCINFHSDGDPHGSRTIYLVGSEYEVDEETGVRLIGAGVAVDVAKRVAPALDPDEPQIEKEEEE